MGLEGDDDGDDDGDDGACVFVAGCKCACKTFYYTL